MLLVERFWSCLTRVVGLLTLYPTTDAGQKLQVPLLGVEHPYARPLPRGPIFKPPGRRITGPGSDFQCDYSNMPGFVSCFDSTNGSCWLRNDKTGVQYDITTDYEDTNQTPIGVTRYYEMNITEQGVNADGLWFPDGKLFNSTYPGPLIQGCWGDNITVIVTNKMKHNGTSVHWHGIRQWLTMHMDGVNGVTQCPIPPGDKFNYTFRAMQYGSWYHSHYSVQYADGAAGPINLYGPSSEPYDEARLPLLMTDWGHNSAFNAITAKLKNESILLNGRGNVETYLNTNKALLPIPTPYNITVDPYQKGQRPKRYLLRLINTSFEATFIFSIDGHTLQVVEADFVPIKSYNTTSVLVGIGQRYHVIVTANDPDPAAKGSYTIRTFKANCFGFVQASASIGYEATGALYYGKATSPPATKAWPNIPFNCSDESLSDLTPIVNLNWTVEAPKNDPFGGIGQNFTVQFQKGGETIFPLAKFSMGGDNFQPLSIDYGNPTFLNLNYSGGLDPLKVVIPESYTGKDWIWMVLKGLQGNTFGAHPIHLHGHDFAILAQVENATFPSGLNLTGRLQNPPRRDVVLLPTNGYAVIAFKTDNPGAWLAHCHIANHAAFGLALQVLERANGPGGATSIWPNRNSSHALQVAQEGCNNWNLWWGNCTNWWPGDGTRCGGGQPDFDPDSGI